MLVINVQDNALNKQKKKEEVSLKEQIQTYTKDETNTTDIKPKLFIKNELTSQDKAQVANVPAICNCDDCLRQFKRNISQLSEKEQDECTDLPSSIRLISNKRKIELESEYALSATKKLKSEKFIETEGLIRKKDDDDEEEEEEEYKLEKKMKSEKTKIDTLSDSSEKDDRRKKDDEESEVWKWWEEENIDDSVKWMFLEHKGPVFAPPYERLPESVKFYYNGKHMKLSAEAEEVAGFYAKMLDHDYTTKNIFNENFFEDWREVMTNDEKKRITDLKKCDFWNMYKYFQELSEQRKYQTKEEKQKLKEENEQILKEYGFCFIDGHKEKIGNFKIEPPGLFRGRGEHPKMGKLKKRVEAEDIIINCSKDSKIPQAPEGHEWKEVRHVNTVTWLASWTENVQNQVKYIMLNPSSKLKGEKDWLKYEIARELHKCIDQIRHEYQLDLKSKDMKICQRAVAMYFIDKLALRAGNEKDEDQADTVGCCSLRVEHIKLHEKKYNKNYVVIFDFLGKDSIRYYNFVPVKKLVFQNLQLFKRGKKSGDELFDELNTQVLNKYLSDLMLGLTAKVFRTYNASRTLQEQLDLLTNKDDTVEEKILAYNRANRAVAVLCNHQRAVPKGYEKSMEKLKEKIEAKREEIRDAEIQVKDLIREAKRGNIKETTVADKKKKMLQKMKEQLNKLEIQEMDRDENKTVALGTSKLNYLDPRITVAWCKKYDIPIEKIYNKTQRDKFRWAIDIAGPKYRFF